MITIGREIENAIGSLMAISEAFADLQAKVDSQEANVTMLDTLFSVSRYIGTNTEAHVVMTVLEDSIKGVFGASECQVIFESHKRHLSRTKTLYQYLNYDDLSNEVLDYLFSDDLSKTSVTTLEQGTLMLVRLSVGEDLFGFLACYWQGVKVMDKSSLLFLRIISTQVSMYLKSASLVESFKELAVLDPLTGIYNRSYLMNIESTTTPIAGENIIMFDIDRFKLINDSKGHQYGDEILKTFASILTKWANAMSGVAFKYGGEEFIIKCGGFEENALKCVEGVRHEFEQKTGYTVSAGISTMGRSCMVANYTHLLRQADDALYVSKQCGRNRYTFSTSDIQILKLSGKALSQLVSKSFRSRSATSLFRFKRHSDAIITDAEFDFVMKEFTSMARLYDQMFITTSLDALIIVNGPIDIDEFIIRSFKWIKEKMPFMSYDIYSLDSVFDEVVVHSSRVSELSQILAQRLGIDDATIEQLRLACEWHDVGKLCTDPCIYTKKGSLTESEFKVIKLHSWLSYSIAHSHPILMHVSDWVLYHHEDYNGMGYFGLVGDTIPYPAQIISLVDKFDALTENRCYRPAYTWQEALEILRKEKYKFSAKLFDTFEAMINQLMKEPMRENQTFRHICS